MIGDLYLTTRVGLVQLGCAKNQVDGEEMLGALASTSEDVRFVADQRDADVIIVNTCAFIESARVESVNAILDAVRLKQSGKISRVIVTGCLAQRYGADLARDIPEVDAFLGIESGPKIGNVVFGDRPSRHNLVDPVLERYPLVPEKRLRATATPWSAYLKVSEGCDHTCTFCAIPGIRGKHRSKPLERLVEEARQLVDTGAVELNLVAQDTTAYGMDLYGRLALSDLLRRLSEISGLQWIRLLYCYPTMVRQELIDTIAELPKVLPYIDMPLQHGDDFMLKVMKRGGSADQYRRLFERIRAAQPDIALRTTFLVGFPGEREEHIETLLRFIQDVRFDRVGVFTYSPEEGTPGFTMPNPVPVKEMKLRKDRVMEMQQSISLANNMRWVGREIDVLIEKTSDDGSVGRSFRDAPEIDGEVFVQGSTAAPGTIVRTKLVGATHYDLVAAPLAALAA